MPRPPQLPLADVAHATRPNLWDGPDTPETAARRRDLEAMRPADRMLLAFTLPVPPTARIVAAVLAYHGWVCFPSLARLAVLTRMDKPHVSRTIRHDLRGYVRTAKRYSSRGRQAIQYVFNGEALMECLDRWRDDQPGNGGKVRDDQTGHGEHWRDDQTGHLTGTGLLTGTERRESDNPSGSLSSRSLETVAIAKQDPTAAQLWEAALGALEVRLAGPSFETFLRGTRGLVLVDEVLVVESPSPFAAEYTRRRLAGAAHEAVRAVSRQRLAVKFVVAEDAWASM